MMSLMSTMITMHTTTTMASTTSMDCGQWQKNTKMAPKKKETAKVAQVKKAEEP